MPALTQAVLFAKLRAALPNGTTFSDEDSVHPADAIIPGFGAARFYLWTVTHIESEDRPPDEYKIQLILPGQGRDERGELNIADKPTFLLGYSPDFGVFVGWEAIRHRFFSFSAAVQVKEALLEEARLTGWAVAPPRRAGGGWEVRVSLSPANLLRFMALTVVADEAELTQNMREAHFLFQTPNSPRIRIPRRASEIDEMVNRVRRDQLVRRLYRDARFGPKIKKQFNFACAVCGTQLEIVEGAHIIPINVDTSRDAIWNGIALCPNHHKLFDAFAFNITPNLEIIVDDATVAYFHESHRDANIANLLEAFDNQQLNRPLFYENDAESRRKMMEALQWRTSLSGLVLP